MKTSGLSSTPDALWLSVNPSFRHLEQQFLVHLSEVYHVSHWGYFQTPDEPSLLDVAVTLLHDSIKGCNHPLHLIGHSTGGLVGLLYARKFPERVQSLTLLGVGVNPAIDWKAHYYTQLDLLPCSRSRVLTQTVHSLFGPQRTHCVKGLREILEQDLLNSLSIHSLNKRFSLFPGGVAVPMLVCGGEIDSVVDPLQIKDWQPWLKPNDRVWICPEGRHFFHASHPHATATEVLDFWQTTESVKNSAIASPDFIKMPLQN